MADHSIIVTQNGAKLTLESLEHPYDMAIFLVNEIVIDPDHFSTRSCKAFRERVLSIWGPGGCRSVVPRVSKCLGCGEVDVCGCDAGLGRKLVPEDRHDTAIDVDGVLRLGRRPHATRAW